MKNRALERLKRKRLRNEKGGITTPIDPITGGDVGPDAEDHHVAGRKFHDDTIRLSVEGHRMITDAQRDLSGSLPGRPTESERIGRYIQGVILILDFVFDRLWEMSEGLITYGREQNARELNERKAERSDLGFGGDDQSRG